MDHRYRFEVTPLFVRNGCPVVPGLLDDDLPWPGWSFVLLCPWFQGTIVDFIESCYNGRG